MKTSRLAIVFLSIAALYFLIFKVPFQLAQSVPANADALWVATIGQLFQLDPDDASVGHQPGNTKNMLRLSIDESRGILWTYSQGRLKAFDSAGNVLSTTSVPPPASSTTNLGLAVDSNNGMVWLGIQKNLHHFNAQGQLLSTIPLPSQTQDLSFDPVTAHLWVATQTTVTALNSSGAVIRTLTLSKNDNVQAVAADRSSGNVWVALASSLRLYNASGTLIAEKTVKGISRLSDDGDHGVWVISGSKLLRLSATLQNLLDIQPFEQKTPLIALASVRDEHSVWVGGNKDLAHLAGNGVRVRRLNLGSNLNDLALFKAIPQQNQSPVAVNDTAATLLNTTLPIQVLANDSDPDNDPLTITAVTQPAHGKVTNTNTIVTYTPATGYLGLDSFTYTISDGQNHTATATVNISVNQAPAITSANAVTFTIGTAGTFTVMTTGFPVPTIARGGVALPSGVTFVNNGNGTATLSATAATGTNGTYALTFTASNGVAPNANQNFTLTVNSAGPVNRPPTITTMAATTATVGQLYSYDVDASDPDTGDVLTFSLDTFPSGMTINSSTGLIQWTPSGTQLGANNVTVRVRDLAGLFATQSFTVQVNPAANGTPFFTSAPPTTATVGQLYGYDADASDPEGDALTFSLDQAPTGMEIDPNTGLIQWTPGLNQLDGHSVVVRVRDVGGRFANQAFVVQVNATPTLPPTITSTPVTAAAVGKPYGYNVIATDPDAGDTITYSLNGAPLGMTINSTTGAIAWTPVITQTGAQNVTAIASDGRGGTAAQTFSIDVSAAQGNRAPIAQDDLYAVRRGDTLTVAAPGVLQNDSDPDGQTLTSQLVAGPTKGAFNLAVDGSFNYTPAPPPPNSTEPQLKFSYSDVNPAISITRTQPIVIDLDKDGVPEIVFISQGPFGTCKLIAVHGNDGSAAFSLNAYQPAASPPIVLCDSFTELAAGDIDGDGFPEIIAVDGDDGINVPAPNRDIFRRQLIALNHDGTHKWTSEDILSKDVAGGLGRITTTGGFRKPLIADLDGDGTPEILVGYSARVATSPGVAGEDFVTAFDNQGRILWTVRGSGSSEGLSPATGTVIVQDIDLDGRPEILYSDDVYDNQGNRLWSAAPCPTCNPRVKDVVVVNLDDDPFAEVVYFDVFGQVYVYEHTGALKWGPLDVGTADSALTVGDVDGDGKAEIVVTSGTNIVVIAGDGSSTRSIPVPLATIFDGSRNTTIFDLNGDGKPELIHQGLRSSFDTASQTGGLYIFDGATGALLHSIRAVRGSGDSGPVVADVNGDGSAEIVTGGWNGSPLLHVFEGKNGPWAKARPIYNQYSYNVTNVNSDGTIPAHPAINWLTPGLNNFLVNMPLPEERTADKDLFTYKANDGALDSNTATARIDILPPNQAPNILSQPPTVASPTIEYLYAVRAFDADVGEVLTFTLPQAPTGMTIDPATGLLRWTPSAGQIGRHTVALKVTDSQGEFAYQGFAIEVVGAVIVPAVIGQTQAAAQSALTGAGLTAGTIVTAASSTVPAGQVISQGIAAGTQVPAGSAVSLVISSGAQTATVPNVIGQTQAAAQSAINGAGLNIGLVATAPSTSVAAGNIISQDPAGGTPVPLASGVNLIVSLGTINLTGLSSIVVEPATAIILVGEEQAYIATGVFNDGTSQNLTGIVGWSSSAPAVATISPVGIAKGLIDGNTTIQASANAITGSATLNVRARVADGTLPNAAIVEPANNAEVTSPVDVVGNATDANFLKYVLDYAVAGETNFTVLTESAVPVSNGLLGKFDPTMLINDQYTLRLTVYDRGGNTQQANVNVQVARDMKVGNFSLTFTDLSVPMSGLPIVVNRVYDSRDKRKGDFGIGWSLSVQTMRIRTNRVLGTGWVRGQSGPSITLSPTDAHKLSVTLPDGKVEEFDMQVSPTSGLGALDFTNVVGFTPRAGTVGKLEALADNSLIILNAGLLDELADFGTLNTYNPQLYRYTSLDGTEFVVHRTNGVQSIKETNGNTLTFGPNGIIHSAGKSALFQRDSDGRITQLTDPRGNVQAYTYDVNGDLGTHTDQLGNITRFSYNGRHDLLQITDPLNRRAVRNEYDADGRLILVTDANGNRTTFAHDLNARREVTTDRLGRVSVFNYDDRGNVLSRTNPQGETTTYTYDSQGNQLTSTNPLGHTTTFTYDSNNNVTSSTDPLGRTTTFSYNSRNQVVTTIDPLGRTLTNSFDASGNLMSLTDSLGRITAFSFDNLGNQLTVRDPLGNITRNTYDPVGNRASLIPPIGNSFSFSYDANGNLRSQADTAGPAYNLIYNAANQPTTIAIGSVTRQLTYDAAGQITKATSPEGREAQAGYDALGLLTQLGPSGGGSGLSQTYNAEGQVISQSDFSGNVTQYLYDGADRLTQTIFPDGTSEFRSYDAASNLIQITDALGRNTRYTYDSAGQQISVINALGNVTSKQYDAAGNLVAVTDPLGQVTQYAYDAANQLVTTTFADGSTEQRFYDTAGRLIQLVGPTGNSFTNTYDALGRLIAVRDGLGHTTRYEFNAVGQRSAVVDANGNRTTFIFDEHGRLLSTSFPGGNTQYSTYDIMGRQLTSTNGNGDTLQYLYDNRGLLNRVTLPTGAQETYTFHADGLIGTATDARGITTFEYHATSRRLVRVIEPDGRYVRYGYDAVGNRTLMAHAVNSGSPEEITQYTYDAVNRMMEVTDPAGGVTRYTYDAAGNQTAIVRPNGTSTALSYNNRNRVIAVTHRNSAGATLASESYTLDAAGNRTRESHADGSRVEYSYDSTGKIIEELHFDVGNSVTQRVNYSYDTVGNLVARTGTLGNASFTYNANNQLVSGDGTIYTYDGAGNLVSENSLNGVTRYTYDARGRLVTHQSPVGALTTYTYDFRGVRQRKSGPAGTTNFLIDRNNATGFAQVVRESDTTGATVRSYVYGSQLLQQNEGGVLSYYHADSLGSVRLLTNGAGVPTDTYGYYAYGQLLARTGASPNAYRFTGEQQDAESNLYYLRARYYNPSIGRFLSRDPFGGDERNPFSIHKYLYADANPVNLTDPSGLLTFSLVEIQASLSIISQRLAVQTPRAYRALRRAKIILGEGSKRAGGAMALDSVFGVFNGNFGLSLKWFGLGISTVKGIWNTARIAVDMLGARNTRIDFDWDAFGCGPLDFARVIHRKNGWQLGIGARANPAVVDLCGRFWAAPFLPNPLAGVNGFPSMAGIMIHEFSHITLGTADHEYLCAYAVPLSFTDSIPIPLGAPNLSLGADKTANADSYRCFARDTYINGGGPIDIIPK